MSWKTYDDLDVFQKAYKLALELHEVTKTFPKEERYSLTSQIRRSSKSVCANIVEGHGKSAISKKEFVRFLSIAIGSAEETRLWLRFCKDLIFISKKDYASYDGGYCEIVKMTHGLIKALQK